MPLPDARPTSQAALAAAQRAFRDPSMSAAQHSQSHRGYQRLEGSSKSDGQGHHLSRSRSLRVPKKQAAVARPTTPQTRLGKRPSLSRLFQLPFSRKQGSLVCSKDCGDESRLSHSAQCAKPVNVESSHLQTRTEPETHPDMEPGTEPDTHKWEISRPVPAPQPPSPPAYEFPPDESELRLQQSSEPVESYRTGHAQLREIHSQMMHATMPRKMSRSNLPEESPRQTPQKPDSKSIAESSSLGRFNNVRQPFRKIPNQLRQLYQRRPSRVPSAQEQLPPQQIEARRSHIFSENTMRRLSETGSTKMLLPPEASIQEESPLKPLSVRRVRHTDSTASVRLPSTGEHVLHDLDGKSHGTSRLTSWADSGSNPSTVIQRHGPSYSVPAEQKPAVPDAAEPIPGPRLRIPRRKSSMSFSTKTNGVDSKSMYSALLNRIKLPSRSTNPRAGDPQTASQQDQTDLCHRDASLALPSVGSGSGRPTVRIVERSPGDDERPLVPPTTLVSDRLRVHVGGGRDDVVSPSVYSSNAYESREHLGMRSLQDVRESQNGTALVSGSRPISIWNLEHRQAKESSPHVPSTSNDWRAWTSKTVEGFDDPTQIRSFSAFGPPVATQEASSGPAALRDISGSMLNNDRVVSTGGAKEPRGNQDESKRFTAPRYPVITGGEGSSQAARRRPATLQPGSPMNERFLKNIRKGPYGIASPDVSPTKTRKPARPQSPYKRSYANENTPPTSREDMVEDFLKSREGRHGSESPVFL